MVLKVNGRRVVGSTSEYHAGPREAIAFISNYITMRPGDVLTLGRVHGKIEIPMSEIADGMRIEGEIEGVGKVAFTLKRSASADTAVGYKALRL